jgi:biopolymer transport protein ExbD
MSWKIRHEGSPRSIDGLNPTQVLQGLADGLWEPTDEVMGPKDRQWQALETHPQFAEPVADMEAPLETAHEEETRLDMNPLIDVALVLLVFFILTTSYAALQKVLDMPDISQKDKPNGPPVLTDPMMATMINLKLSQNGDDTIYTVEGQAVPLDDLKNAIQQYVSPGKTDVVMEVMKSTPEVPWGAFITAKDRAQAAGVQHVHMLKRR